MASYIRRRKFLATLLGGVVAWPLAAQAQQPAMPVIGFLNARSLRSAYARELQEAAGSRGHHIHILNASTEGEIDIAFASLVQLRAGAVLIVTDTFFTGWRDQLVALAARYAIPAIYDIRDFAAAGGLISYGTNFADLYRQAGLYA